MTITIASAQYPITYHQDFAAWQTHVQAWVEIAVVQKGQILVFPEYGSMELTSIMRPEIQQDIQQQVVELSTVQYDFCTVWESLAKRHGITIIAPSIPIIEDGKAVNRVFVFSPKGLVGYQDKVFMTRFENEVWGVTSGGASVSIFESDWGSFGIQICYDVEFAIGADALAKAGASLIVAPSCTETIRGATRVHVGARARAMENQLYVAVSQTVNNALWSPSVDINYGYAAVYATPDQGLPQEGIVSSMSPQNEGWLMQSLDMNLLESVRKEGQVFNYKDSARVRMTLDGLDIKTKKHII